MGDGPTHARNETPGLEDVADCYPDTGSSGSSQASDPTSLKRKVSSQISRILEDPAAPALGPKRRTQSGVAEGPEQVLALRKGHSPNKSLPLGCGMVGPGGKRTKVLDLPTPSRHRQFSSNEKANPSREGDAKLRDSLSRPGRRNSY